jgi:hypothetical protein
MKDQKMNETEVTTEMSAVPPSIETEQDAPIEPDPGKRGKVIITVIAAVVVAIVLCVGGWLWLSSHQHSMALDDCTHALTTYRAKLKGFTASRAEGEAASKVTMDQVKDAETVQKLASDMKVSAKDFWVSSTVCKSANETPSLNNSTSILKSYSTKMADAGILISKDAKAVTDSKSAKELADATTQLGDKITAAQGTLDSTSGKVSDNAVRDVLQNEIAAAAKLRDDGKRTVEAMKDEITKLETAAKAVSDDVAAKAAADQAAAQAAATAAANANRSTSKGSTTTRRSTGSSTTKRSTGGTPTQKSTGSSNSGGSSSSTGSPSAGHYDWTKVDNTYACKPGSFCPIG